MRSQEGSHLQLGWLLGTLKVSTHTVSTWVQWHMALPHHWVRIKSWFHSFWVRFCWECGHRRVPIYSSGDYWGHWRCQRILFPPGFSGIWHFPTIGLESNLDFILSGSGSAGNAVTGGFPSTARVTIGDIEGVNTALPHHWVRIKSWLHSFWVRFCWECGHRRVPIYSSGDYWGHWRCQHILFPPGFSGIWHFPTIGLESNLDFILSGSGSAGNAVTGGFPFTAWVTIGDIEGVNTYCFHLGSVAYGTSPPLG